MAARSLLMVAAALLLVTLALPSATAAKECGPKCTARYERMVGLREDSSVIRVRADTFKELIRTGPRNYSVVLLLNAESPKRGCQPCLAAAGVYQAVADSFYAQHPSARNEVFFASADYDSGGEEIFQKMDCKSAPVFFFIKPEGQPVRSLAQMYEADEIAIYIQKATGRKFTVKRPVDVTKVIITLSVVAAIAFVIKTFWSVVYRVISNPSLWAYISITFALMMMGGQMWMQIRGAPFTQPTQDGSMTLYHGSSSYQYGIEVLLVMVLQGGVTIGAVILGDHAPNLKGNLQRTTTLIGVGMVIGIFSLLYRVFREKYGGYPYKLLF